LINKAKFYRARKDHTCKEQVGLIADYLAGALKPTVLAAFEQHLDQCPDCTAFLKTYKKTVEATKFFLKMPLLTMGPLSLRMSPGVIRLITTVILWLHLFIANHPLTMQ
jgi:anti-sigma factor RsiW